MKDKKFVDMQNNISDVKEKKYSVLMSIYIKENPDFLKESIISMFDQTLIPDEIVLVKDGPLTPALEKVLNDLSNNKTLKTISLKENVGLGLALNEGLKICKNDIIARMDTDDISMPDRCYKQFIFLEKNKEISIVGSAVNEFIENPSNIIAYKGIKEDHKEISKQIKFRNPMNHPTVMYRKKDVLSAGSYQHWFLNEDYFLWIRMFLKGFKFSNINEPLVLMRVTKETYQRRGGLKYYKTQKELFKYMLKNKMINISEYLFNNGVRFGIRVLVPNKVRELVYLKILRKKK